MTGAAMNIAPRSNNLSGSAAILSMPRARIYRNAGLSIATGLGTILLFDSVEYDTDSCYRPSIATSRLYASTNGMYEVKGAAEWPSAGGLGERLIRIMKNGTTLYPTSQIKANPDGLTDPQETSQHVEMNAGDYVELLVTQNSGVLLPFNAATLTNRVNGLEFCLISTP